MFAYLFAWLIYIAASLGLLWVYKKGIAHYLPQAIQPILLVLAACILLTPWPIDSTTWVPAPAIVATMFHAMSGFGVTALKSLFPILAVSTIACFAAWFINRKQST